MKKLKLIYNPYSGNKTFKFELDSCLKIFQKSGYETHIFRSSEYGDIENHFKEMDKSYDILVVSGGDGTINIVLNCMMKNNYNIPIGIIPSGTANDFASYLKLPSSFGDCAKIITSNKKQKTDIGFVNDSYFINVCAAGLFSNISQLIDKDFKDTLGKLAYYIQGVKQLPNFNPISVKITNSNKIIESDIYLFIILNTSGTGGFNNLSPSAKINDGMFDFIGFRATNIKDLARLFLKIITQDYLEDSSVIYFKDNYIKVEITNSQINPIYLHSDIDGEQGPCFPIQVNCISNKIDIFIP